MSKYHVDTISIHTCQSIIEQSSNQCPPRVQECDQFFDWGPEGGDKSGQMKPASLHNMTHFTALCRIEGKRWAGQGRGGDRNISLMITHVDWLQLISLGDLSWFANISVLTGGNGRSKLQTLKFTKN